MVFLTTEPPGHGGVSSSRAEVEQCHTVIINIHWSAQEAGSYPRRWSGSLKLRGLAVPLMKLYIFWRRLDQAEDEFCVNLAATLVRWLLEHGAGVFNSALHSAACNLSSVQPKLSHHECAWFLRGEHFER